MTERFKTYMDNDKCRVRIDDEVENKELFHIYFVEFDDAVYLKSRLRKIIKVMNSLNEEKEFWKSQSQDWAELITFIQNEMEEEGYMTKERLKDLIE